jgi:hypothetical protein
MGICLTTEDNSNKVIDVPSSIDDTSQLNNNKQNLSRNINTGNQTNNNITDSSILVSSNNVNTEIVYNVKYKPRAKKD